MAFFVFTFASSSKFIGIVKKSVFSSEKVTNNAETHKPTWNFLMREALKGRIGSDWSAGMILTPHLLLNL